MDEKILVIVIIQLATSITFLIIPLAALRFGENAQRIAENFLTSQDIDSNLLAKNNFRLAESKKEALFPFGICLLFAIVGLLNFKEYEIGRSVSWVIHIFFFFFGGLVTSGQVFPVWFTKQAFKKSNDLALKKIDVDNLIKISYNEFPNWLRPIIIFRFILLTLGSIIVMLLLMKI
jgi:hypothetical protein